MFVPVDGDAGAGHEGSTFRCVLDPVGEFLERVRELRPDIALNGGGFSDDRRPGAAIGDDRVQAGDRRQQMPPGLFLLCNSKNKPPALRGEGRSLDKSKNSCVMI